MTRAAGRLGVPRDAWYLYGILVLTQSGYTVIIPLLAAMQQEFGLSYGEASLAWTAFGLARLVTDIPAGSLVARFERRRLLLGSILIGALGLCYTALAPSFVHVIASRIVFGVSSSLVTAILLTWLVDLATPANRGRVMAYQESGWSFTAIFTPIVAGFIAAALDWRASLVFGALLSLTSLALLLPLPSVRSRAAPAGAARADTSVGGVLRAGGPILVATYVVAFLLFFNRNGFVMTFSPLFAGDVLRLGPDTIGLGVAIYSSVSFLAVTSSGPIMDRIGKHAMVVPALVATAVGDLLFLLATGFPGYALGLSVIALNASANGVAPALIGDLLAAPYRPMAAALYRFVADLAILIAPFFIGLLFDRFGAGLTIPIVASIAGLALLAYSGLMIAGRRATLSPAERGLG